MKRAKRLLKTVAAVIIAVNLMILPICASENVAICAEPRLNNIFSASLSLGFDTDNVIYCNISVTPYSHCTGFDGIMRLFDADGNQLKSWSISDFEEAYMQERTWQCEYGKTYTVTFQGYAYGTDSMYDEINLSNTGTCED